MLLPVADISVAADDAFLPCYLTDPTHVQLDSGRMKTPDMETCRCFVEAVFRRVEWGHALFFWSWGTWKWAAKYGTTDDRRNSLMKRYEVRAPWMAIRGVGWRKINATPCHYFPTSHLSASHTQQYHSQRRRRKRKRSSLSLRLKRDSSVNRTYAHCLLQLSWRLITVKSLPLNGRLEC